MKNKITIFVLLVMLITVNADAQWVPQFLPPEGGLMISLDFRDINNGCIGGWYFDLDNNDEVRGRIYYTSSGGALWHQSVIPDTVHAITGIKFINSMTGYAVGAYNISSGKTKNILEKNTISNIGRSAGLKNYKGLVIKTTNAGASWFTFGKVPDHIDYLLSFNIIDTQTVYVCTSEQSDSIFRAGISKTDLNFENWSPLGLPVDTGDVRKLYVKENFISGIGYEKSGDTTAAMILRSTDAGISWTKTISNLLDEFNDICFINENTGFISGLETEFLQPGNSYIYNTTDKGITWTDLNMNLGTRHVLGINGFPDQNSLICYGSTGGSIPSGFIGRSGNLGTSWTFQNIPIENLLVTNSIFFNSLNAYCIGSIPRKVGLFQIVFDPVVLKTSNGGSVFVSPQNENIADSYKLYQNFPNPFNPGTVIRYEITPLDPPFSKGGNGVFVRLKVYDILGNEVAVLVNQRQAAGSYSVKFDGSNLSSGIYFYKLEAGEFSEVRKMILMK